MLSLVAGLMFGIASSVQSPPAAEAGGLVVHEWGTFTTFAGPDGQPREFQTAIGAELPKFVYSRALQAGYPDDHELGAIKFLRDSLVRMETPVLYFYTGASMKVDVEVRMPKGALTEFYPPVTRMEPAYEGLNKERAADGALVWNGVQLVPDGSSVKAPAVTDGNHYAEARAVDAAGVRFEGLGGTHDERFLFYRGIGNFDPAVRARALGGGRVKVMNQQGAPIPAAILMDVEGGAVRFAAHGRIEREAELALPAGSSSMDELGSAVERALVEAGLYAKEAAAMVKTWRSSWFQEEGTRVLYILPGAVTDEVVPLKVTPAPAKTVRVFVGRAEVLTPEALVRVEKELAACGDSGEGWRSGAVKRLGRFAVPAVKCVEASGTSEAGRASARRMLGR